VVVIPVFVCTEPLSSAAKRKLKRKARYAYEKRVSQRQKVPGLKSNFIKVKMHNGSIYCSVSPSSSFCSLGSLEQVLR
jgi:hypothetical protein